MPARTYIGTDETQEGALDVARLRAQAKGISGEPYKTSWEITLGRENTQYKGAGDTADAAYITALANAGITDGNVTGYETLFKVHATFEAPTDVAQPAGASMRTGVKGGSLTRLL